MATTAFDGTQSPFPGATRAVSAAENVSPLVQFALASAITEWPNPISVFPIMPLPGGSGSSSAVGYGS